MDQPVKKIPDFVYIEHPDFKGKTLILQTAMPGIIGHVWRFKNQSEAIEFENKNTGVVVKIPGYYIYITPFASLTLNPNEHLIIKDVMDDMANFFLNNRIIPDAKYYKRYQEAV